MKFCVHPSRARNFLPSVFQEKMSQNNQASTGVVQTVLTGISSALGVVPKEIINHLISSACDPTIRHELMFDFAKRGLVLPYFRDFVDERTGVVVTFVRADYVAQFIKSVRSEFNVGFFLGVVVGCAIVGGLWWLTHPSSQARRH
jgi:hypothetical protein